MPYRLLRILLSRLPGDARCSEQWQEKLYGEWTSMKDHAKDAEDFQAAQQAKAQCLALGALQLSDDMSDQDLSAAKGVLERSSDAIPAAKRFRTV